MYLPLPKAPCPHIQGLAAFSDNSLRSGSLVQEGNRAVVVFFLPLWKCPGNQLYRSTARDCLVL